MTAVNRRSHSEAHDHQSNKPAVTCWHSPLCCFFKSASVRPTSLDGGSKGPNSISLCVPVLCHDNEPWILNLWILGKELCRRPSLALCRPKSARLPRALVRSRQGSFQHYSGFQRTCYDTRHLTTTPLRRHLPMLMALVDRKWPQRRLEVLTKESPSVATVVLDLRDRLGELVTTALLAATASMADAVNWPRSGFSSRKWTGTERLLSRAVKQPEQSVKRKLQSNRIFQGGGGHRRTSLTRVPTIVPEEMLGKIRRWHILSVDQDDWNHFWCSWSKAAAVTYSRGHTETLSSLHTVDEDTHKYILLTILHLVCVHKNSPDFLILLSGRKDCD